MRLVRTACQAGAHPKARPVANDSASAQPSSRRSGVKFSVIGSCTFAGIAAPSSSAVQNVSRTASVPAVSASSVLSVSSWRTTRQRPAPMARRMAISRRLTVALARNRLATLPQAMSQTSPDAQSASVAIRRTCGRWFSCLACSSATTSSLGGFTRRVCVAVGRNRRQLRRRGFGGDVRLQSAKHSEVARLRPGPQSSLPVLASRNGTLITTARIRIFAELAPAS